MKSTNLAQYKTRPQLAKGFCKLITAFILSACGGERANVAELASPEPTQLRFATEVALGKALFSDKNLSFNRTQACATCHNPEHAFIDDRLNSSNKIAAVSLGDDNQSLGDRNAPTASYARFSPEFHKGTSERINSKRSDYIGWIGGQFIDGREADLKGQAGGPPLNPIEMGMKDKASVIARIQENADYSAAFKAIYGNNLFNNTDDAYLAMTKAIGTFEKSNFFQPFDSKYDRSLKGEYTLSEKESLGKALFFSPQFSNCATCHQLKAVGNTKETFTSYEYHNIGVPVNTAVRNQTGVTHDDGLLANPKVTATTEKGKYKTATLRNIAVTEPYMHNGVFRDLQTVIKFYDHYLSNSLFANNPETGQPWREPEVADNLNLTELQDGVAMTQEKVEAMVCFLRTLTDQRYEHLIAEKGIKCSDQ